MVPTGGEVITELLLYATPGGGRLGVGALGEVVEEVAGELGSRGTSRGGSTGTESENTGKMRIY